MKETIQILQFKIQDNCLGCNVAELEQILPMMTLELIPNSPPHFQGMMNLNGTLIPVFDLSRYLQLPPFSYDLDTCILLVKTEDKSVGFIVEQVNDLFSVEKNRIQKNDLFNKNGSPYLGSVVIDSAPCLILQFQFIVKEVCFPKR